MSTNVNLPSELIQKAKAYAIQCHMETNHTYDGKPYETHLQIVYEFGMKYSFLLPKDKVDYALAACWTHDTIEDCRQTYNDVKAACGETIAEITYALTNEKGKSRKERANEKYYEGIRQTPLASFVKVCDRLANAKYSKEINSKMIEAYRKEKDHFKEQLWSDELKQMFEELEELLS
jgi:(p)ppGpp synthase/HD superfamily hydrolase